MRMMIAVFFATGLSSYAEATRFSCVPAKSGGIMTEWRFSLNNDNLIERVVTNRQDISGNSDRFQSIRIISRSLSENGPSVAVVQHMDTNYYTITLTASVDSRGSVRLTTRNRNGFVDNFACHQMK